MDLELQNRPKIEAKSVKKHSENLIYFCIAFYIDFGPFLGLDLGVKNGRANRCLATYFYQKCAFSLTKRLFLHVHVEIKSCARLFGIFFTAFCFASHLVCFWPPKPPPKSTQKVIQYRYGSCIFNVTAVGKDFWSIFKPFWIGKSIIN